MEHGGLIGQGAGEGQQDVNMQGWKSNPADRWGLWQGFETRVGLQVMAGPGGAPPGKTTAATVLGLTRVQVAWKKLACQKH